MFKSVGANWFVTIATILSTYALTPFSLETLGNDAYGAWLVITSLTSYLTLIRGGLPAASVRYISEHVSTSDTTGINGAIASCMRIYLWLGALAFVVGGGLFVAYESWYETPPEQLWQTRIAFALVTFEVSFGFLSHLPYALMEAHDDWIVRNYVRIASVVLRVVLTFGLLTIEPNILALAGTLLLCTTFELVAGAIVASRRYPGVRFQLSGGDRELAGKILKYGAYVLLLSVGGRLAFKSDALVIGKWCSLEDVSIYSVGNSLVLYLMEFIISIAIVVMPRSARMRKNQDEEGLRELFLKWTKISGSISQLIGMFLLVMGPEFIAWWINPEFAARGAASMQVLIFSFLFFLPIRGVGIPILMGVGNIAVPSFAFLGLGVVNVALSIALVQVYGMFGASLGTAIPNIIFAFVIVFIVCREVNVSVVRFFTYTSVRILLGSAPMLGYLAVCKYVLHASGFWGLLWTGLGYLALFGAIWTLFVYRNDEFVRLSETRIGRKFPMLFPTGR